MYHGHGCEGPTRQRGEAIHAGRFRTNNQCEATKGAYPSFYHSSCLGFDDGCGRLCSRSLIASQYRSCWRRDKSSLPINHCSVYPLRILYCMRRYRIIPSYPSHSVVLGLPVPSDSNRHAYRNGRRRFWRLPLFTLSAVTLTHSSMVCSRLPTLVFVLYIYIQCNFNQSTFYKYTLLPCYF